MTNRKSSKTGVLKGNVKQNKWAIFVFAAVFAVVGVITLLPSKGMSNTQAKQADEFVNSIGVNTHLHYGWPDPYSDFTKVQGALTELGVRNIRDFPVPQSESKIAALGNNGIKITGIMGVAAPRSWMPHSLSELYDVMKRQVNNVAAFEGPNEWDVSGDPDWATNIRNYQQQLWTMVKNDPITTNKTVLGPSITWASNTQIVGNMSNWLDYGNIHPYPGGRTPDNRVGDDANASKTYVTAGKPVAATETGYHNALSTTTTHPPVSESAMATYTPRMLLGYYNQGIPKTFLYELLDQFSSNSDPEGNFGLVRLDFSRKPAFYATKNLITLLSDPGPSFAPGQLSFDLSGSDANTKYTLLQKRNGTFWLAVWQETKVWDESTRTSLDPPNVPLTLNLNNSAYIRRYAPNQGIDILATGTGTSFGFTSSEQVTLLEITPYAESPSLPDLIVTNLTFSPTRPSQGAAVTFSATIKNQGSGPVPNNSTSTVRFKVDGSYITLSSASLANLAPGATRIVSADSGPAGSTWPSAKGRHSVEVYADDQNQISESSETNNIFLKQINIK